jgi:hypothetical protein
MPLASPAQDFTVFLGGAVPGAMSINNVQTNLDNGHVWGFRLSNRLAATVGLEHTLAFSSDFLFPSDVSEIKDAKGLVFNSNLIVNIPLGKAIPYGTTGIGFIRQYGSENLPVGWEFAVNYGGGLKAARLFGPLGLRFDARGYSTGDLNIFEFSAGLLVSF